MRSTRIAPLVAFSAVAALVPALTPAVASAAAPTPLRTVAADPLKRYTQQTPRWQRCDAEAPADFQCATLKVPLDYSKPGGRTLDVAVSRIKATDPRSGAESCCSTPADPAARASTCPST